MDANVNIQCEICKQKLTASALSNKGKWFCSKKCLDEFKHPTSKPVPEQDQ